MRTAWPGRSGDARIKLSQDSTITSIEALLLAVGSNYRRLDIPGEEDFIGAGVHFCATCDGPFYRDKDVLVIGGGNSAGEESLFLTRFARHVTIAMRNEQLSASRVIAQKVQEHPDIEVMGRVTPIEFKGEQKLQMVVLQDEKSGQRREIHPAGVFIFIGLTPNTQMLQGVITLDEHARRKHPLATSLPWPQRHCPCRFLLYMLYNIYNKN